jgi:thiamine-phosphate pyrophosphorylase
MMNNLDPSNDLKDNPPSLPAADRVAALRIIDANFNRASEGLRVIEEHLRLGLDDSHLTRCCKELRHELAEAVSALPTEHLHASRDTQADVGTAITTPAEGSRRSLAQVAAANWQRVLQALRAIEEYSKLLAPPLAARIEALRYRAYTLSKAASVTADSHERLRHARLYVLIDGGSAECEFVERAQELIGAGVHALQLRDKRLDDRTLLARGRLLKRIIDDRRQETGVSSQGTGDRKPSSAGDSLPLFIVNDRPDLAVLARADGVHVGQEELSVREVRQIVGPEMLVGVSTHSIEQARQAVLDGADYLGCGPTFPSGTKQFDQFPGADFLRQVAAEISLPAFAIGGITRENLPQVLATGITRVAVSGAIAGDADPHSAAAGFLAALGKLE